MNRVSGTRHLLYWLFANVFPFCLASPPEAWLGVSVIVVEPVLRGKDTPDLQGDDGLSTRRANRVETRASRAATVSS